MNRKIKRCIGISSILVLIFIIGRIFYVNQNLHVPNVETYNMGECVKLENNYFLEEYEIAEDYSIVVDNARVISCNDFLKECNYAGKLEDLFPIKDKLYPEMIYEIDVTIKNNGSEDDSESGMNLSQFDLMAIDYRLQINDILYQIANPYVENGTMMFHLQPQSELSFRLPYFFTTTANNSFLTTKEVLRDEIYLVVSAYPTQKQILIEPENRYLNEN